MPKQHPEAQRPGQDHRHGCHGAACAGHHTDNIHADEARPGKDDLLWRVEGMDCASCAATITTALERLPGVRQISVSLMRERLSLSLDEQQTSRRTIEKTVAALGYKAVACNPGSPELEIAEKSWWQTSKGIRAIMAGLLLALAFIIAAVRPPWALPAFTAATALALVPVMLKAFAALKNGSPFTIEMLMTIAATGAIFIGATQEAAVVVFLFCIGELLEGMAAGRARARIKALGKLAPKTALREKDGTVEHINASDIKIGDIIMARPGDRIAADGRVAEGVSNVNEAPITGESMPSSKQTGDTVFAGSINLDAALRIHVDKNASDNTIARIIALVENAQDAKTPTERFIDSFARIYMPVIVSISLLTALLPPLLFGAEWSVWIYRALTLLLIGCPCALVISVPAAVASSLAAGARSGLLIKGGQVLETLAKTSMMAFDKTGTLTNGEPMVTDVVDFTGDERHLLATATALEQEASHPLAAAITAYAAQAGIRALAVKNTRVVAGKGVTANADGQAIFIGAPRFASEYGALDDTARARINELEDQGKTVIAVMTDGRAAGLFALRDEPRRDAGAAIAQLKKLGIHSIMMTGDNHRTAQAIAAELGIDARAELLPDMKAEIIRSYKGKNVIAMVGDGINDAPALVTADVGIAMGSGTDVALETADAAVLYNRMGDLPALVDKARATMRIIRQNVTIALGLKLVFLLTTLLGISGLWAAILADTGATVLVTLNALRLLVTRRRAS